MNLLPIRIVAGLETTSVTAATLGLSATIDPMTTAAEQRTLRELKAIGRH